MRHYLALVSVMLLVAVLGRAQGPDEKYIQIYNLIQEADRLSAKDQTDYAAKKYLEAHTLLSLFPAEHPGWNEKVVQYRLNYLAAKLGPLINNLPATSAPPATIPAAPDPASSELTNQVRRLQEEIARFSAQNALLEAKLKEALSVQPAAMDPRELAQAQETIRTLQKQIDLLKVSSEPQPTQAPQPPDASVTTQEQTILTAVKEQLTRQTALAQTLQKANDDLKQQLAGANPAVPAAAGSLPASEELRVSRNIIAALQATNIALRTELILMETRLADVTQKKILPAAGMTALLQERDELRRELAIVNNILAKRRNRFPLTPAEFKAGQLDALLARVEVYEAEAVPYTAEELALFRKGNTNQTTLATAGADKITVAELPPGTGPLIAEAEHAADTGRYQRAEELFLQVLRQDESHVRTLINLAGVQMEQNRLAEAEATINKALKVAPQDPLNLYMLGLLKYKQGKYDEALAALSQSAKLLPGAARTQFFLGQTLVEKGQRQAAETVFRKAIQLKPDFGAAHHSLALVYARQQPPFKELAQWHYEKAKACNPTQLDDPELEKLLSDDSGTNAPPP